MKNVHILFIFYLGLIGHSCNSSTQTNTSKFSNDSLAITQHDSAFTQSDEAYFSETATYYVVVNDTGMNYYQLREQLFAIHAKSKQEIDTLGRYYNATKNLIALSDTDEDEMYRGDYYPRRFPSTSLSLEYLALYMPNTQEKTIALVSGIYENKEHADSAKLHSLSYQPKTFVVKASVYTGCMH